MTNKAAAEKWLTRAQYDLETSEAMLKARRYLYVGFTCQQAIEKILKGIIIHTQGEIAFTHNLVKLAEIAGIFKQMTNAQKRILTNLTPFAVEARYGDFRDKLSEILNREKAKSLLKNTKVIFRWLKKKI
jgi:HEPN domain-containing protein